MMEREGRTSISGVAWETLWEQASGPMVLLDLQGRVEQANPALCRILGYAEEELIGLASGDVTYPEDPVIDREVIEQKVRDGTRSFAQEKRLVRSDGSVVWALIDHTIINRPDGTPQLIIAQLSDITARVEAEDLWRQTLINAPIGMALLDLHTHLIEVNDRFCELIGYRREELVGSRGLELVYTGYQKPVEDLFAGFRAGRTRTSSTEICVRHRDGQPFWIKARFSALLGADDQPIHVVGQYEPLGVDSRVSEERLVELTRMALHDPLTGLANRALLLDRFQQELAGLSDRPGALAVLLIDLDGLKTINDRHGHEAGDRFLQAAARELQDSVRSADTVARVGGDEFVVLANVTDEFQAEGLRSRIDQRLNADSRAMGKNIRLGASVGMTVASDSTASTQELLARADRDMYARKGSGAR